MIINFQSKTPLKKKMAVNGIFSIIAALIVAINTLIAVAISENLTIFHTSSFIIALFFISHGVKHITKTVYAYTNCKLEITDTQICITHEPLNENELKSTIQRTIPYDFMEGVEYDNIDECIEITDKDDNITHIFIIDATCVFDVMKELQAKAKLTLETISFSKN